MFQEYRDWEKAFQKHTADENANIDTNKLWHNLKDHVPAKNKQNRWLPFFVDHKPIVVSPYRIDVDAKP
jgi:hypothetical protein